MQSKTRHIIVLVSFLAGIVSGCGRDYPPEIRKFIPPVEETVQETHTNQAPDTTPEPETKAPPPPEPKKVEKTAAPAPAKPKPKPKPVVVDAPSIVGSWQVVKMPGADEMPEGMEMTATFTEDGTFTMNISIPQAPEPQTMEGTYTVDGDQITVTMMGETKTGTFRFDGPDTLILEIDGDEMTLSRM